MRMRPLRALFAAAVVTAGVSAGAQAADVGQCGSPQEMNEWMQAEGQRSLATGNRHNVIDTKTGRRVNSGIILTADSTGRVGYVLEADQLMGTPASKVCVALRMQDVRLFDPRRPGVPAGARIAASDEAGRRDCRKREDAYQVGRGDCGPLNVLLERSEAVGNRALLQGLGVKKQSNGGYAADGGLITLTVTLPGQGTDPDGTPTPKRDGIGAVSFTALPNGASTLAMVFTDTKLTPHAIQLLDQPQVAMAGTPPQPR